MDHTVDTVIVGAGPAGTSCAVTLQRSGVTNLVIEKRAFPRDKLCGGLVTEKTYRLICELWASSGEEIPPDLFCDLSDRVELRYRTERLAGAKVQKSFRKIRRSHFDNALVELYKKTGGTLLENSECADIDMKNRRIVLQNGDEIAFCHLVAADGALSRTRKMLGYPSPRLGLCTEVHVPKTGNEEDGVVRIHFGVVKYGYGWIFPSGSELCVGLGGAYRKGDRPDESLREYLSMNSFPRDVKIKGAFIPFGDLVDQKRGPKEAVLVGDAGGFADPLTGEGLFFALSTGIAAANAVVNSRGDPDNFKRAYLNAISPIEKTIRQGKRTQKMFFGNIGKSVFRKKITGKNGFVGFFSDNQLSEYGYEYSKIIDLVSDYRKQKNQNDL